MLWSALLIHLSGGRIETHFHVFGSLGFLAAYRDWPVLITTTVVVAADHLIRGLVWPESVYGIVNPEWWRAGGKLRFFRNDRKISCWEAMRSRT